MAVALLKDPQNPFYSMPRFLPVIGQRGGLHIVSVDKVANRDAEGEICELEGRAFCGSTSPSYWTNWAPYAKVDDLCKRCLKSWLRACIIESDSNARAELKALFGGEAE